MKKPFRSGGVFRKKTFLPPGKKLTKQHRFGAFFFNKKPFCRNNTVKTVVVLLTL